MKFKVLKVKKDPSNEGLGSLVTVQLEDGTVHKVESWNPEEDTFFYHIQKEVEKLTPNGKSKIASILNKEFKTEKYYNENKHKVWSSWF